MDENQGQKSLSRAQKTGFVLLLIFGILAFGLGMLQMRNTIFSPFAIDLGKLAGSQEGLFTDEQTRLQSIDTDHDSLNDWEELNFYQTSPYLADTDSDKISDKKEIEQGTNPLCPEGEACETSEAMPVTTNTLMESPLTEGGFTPLDILTGTSASGTEGAAYAEIMSSFQDPAKLRQMLLSSGEIKKESLDKISDDELLKMVGELLLNQNQ